MGSLWSSGGAILAVGFLGALIAAGPLTSTYYYPNNWTAQPLFHYDYDEEDNPYWRLFRLQ
jgi:hypothetical protein